MERELETELELDRGTEVDRAGDLERATELGRETDLHKESSDAPSALLQGARPEGSGNDASDLSSEDDIPPAGHQTGARPPQPLSLQIGATRHGRTSEARALVSSAPDEVGGTAVAPDPVAASQSPRGTSGGLAVSTMELQALAAQLETTQQASAVPVAEGTIPCASSAERPRALVFAQHRSALARAELLLRTHLPGLRFAVVDGT